MRVTCIESIDIRQQNEKIRFQICGYNRRERIIIADYNFIRGNGIVFIHNRKCTKLKQTKKRVTKIFAALFMLDVLLSQKYLRDSMIVFPKQLVIRIHQFTLTNSCCRLFARNIGGPVFQSQFADTHSNGTRRNQNDFMACIFEIAYHTTKIFYPANIQKPGLISECRCTDLNYNPHIFLFLPESHSSSTKRTYSRHLRSSTKPARLE